MDRYSLIIITCELLFFVISCEKDPITPEKRPVAPTINFIKLELPAWLTALDDSLAQYVVLTLKNINYVNNLHGYVNDLEENFDTNDEPEDIFNQPWSWNYKYLKPLNGYLGLYQVLDQREHYYWNFYAYNPKNLSRSPLLEAIKLKDDKEQTVVVIHKENPLGFSNYLLWSWYHHEGEFCSVDYYRQMNTLEPRYWFRNLVADDCRIYDGGILKVTITMEKANEMLIVISTYNYDDEEAKWRTRNRFILNNFKKIGEWICYSNKDDEITSQGTWNGE